MIKPLESILFATDLTPNCQPAYDYVVALSVCYSATVYILYVTEKMPGNVGARLKGLLGRHQWEDLMQTKEETVRKSLTGKLTSSGVLHDIKVFCQNVEVADDQCKLLARKVIVSTGDVAEMILSSAQENKCDLIVLGARDGVLSRNHVNDTIKTVLKRASVPVTVVPSKVES